MKPVFEFIVAVLALIAIVAIFSVVPVAAWGFLLLFGISFPLWKIVVAYVLFAIIMKWFSAFFKTKNN